MIFIIISEPLKHLYLKKSELSLDEYKEILVDNFKFELELRDRKVNL